MILYYFVEFAGSFANIALLLLFIGRLEIDRTAQERVDTMLPHMMEGAGVTEELKACDPMRWVGLMNTLKAQAEEIIQDELIYK